MFIIRDREAGNYITEFETKEEAEEMLNHYAHIDMLEDLNENDALKDEESYKEFYEIIEVNEND